MVVTALITLFSFSTTKYPCNHNDGSYHNVEYIKNYDGDTITFNIPNVCPILGKMAGVRLNGIDTPEIRTKNKQEKSQAIAAGNYVRNALQNAKKIELRNVTRGKYFRLVADIFYDGKSLAQELLEKGYG